ncbi:hypothetical protein [Dokdonella sp.]|uniref:hypothetical protein n=1 Tax=Dokdonella sp. TaxID=2291710 RepID=UPI0025C44D12|nr:hypothetical protein [Dokdonella sp.]MBX3688982.1 hypothetical protein [Dokdonella sp.]
MSRESPDNTAAAIVIGGAAAVFIVIWKFSTSAGLDMDTGARVLAYMLVWTAAIVGLLKGPNIPLGSLLPLALATPWMCWCPALDHRASKELLYSLSLDVLPGTDRTMVWWAAWYTKASVLLAILGGGYGVKAWRSDAY